MTISAVLGAVIILSIVVVIHEAGHYFVARMCGVGVYEFAVGFGPRVWSRESQGTVYSLRAIPLGGFVSMVGEPGGGTAADPSVDDGLTDSQRALQKDSKLWFSGKKIWQRALIVLAGPAFNLISCLLFAFVSLWAFGYDIPTNRPIVGELSPELPAAKAGVRRGDYIRAIDGKEIVDWNSLLSTVRASGGKPLELQIDRSEGEVKMQVTLTVTPSAEDTELDKVIDALSTSAPEQAEVERSKRRYRIGVSPYDEKISLSWQTAVYLAPMKTYAVVDMTVRSLWLLVKGVLSTKNISGPIGVLQGASHSAERGLESSIGFLLILSVGLAIFNLLPIPVLDGGHVILLLIEGLVRRPLKEGEIVVATRIGLACILSIMALAIVNDVTRLFF